MTSKRERETATHISTEPSGGMMTIRSLALTALLTALLPFEHTGGVQQQAASPQVLWSFEAGG